MTNLGDLKLQKEKGARLCRQGLVNLAEETRLLGHTGKLQKSFKPHGE